jgi:hypothetical protein
MAGGGAIHTTPAVKAAAAPPSAGINTLAFIPGSSSLEDDGNVLPLVVLAE